jgi:hypothetical protein
LIFNTKAMQDKTGGLINEEALKQELIETFGLGDMLPEDQEASLNSLSEALIKTIFLRTFERLGDEGVTEYERLLERATKEEQVAEFLEAKIPGYNVFVKEIVEEFKHSLAEDLAKQE